VLDHVGLQQLGPKSMQRRLQSEGGDCKTAEKRNKMSNAETLRHPFA
jgi:hypothetical protein